MSAILVRVMSTDDTHDIYDLSFLNDDNYLNKSWNEYLVFNYIIQCKTFQNPYLKHRSAHIIIIYNLLNSFSHESWL